MKEIRNTTAQFAMTETKTILHRNVIAEIYDHEWSDDVIMAKTPSGLKTPEEKRVSLKFVEEFADRRGYEIEFYGNSDNSMRIIDEYKKRVCEECESKVMYDSESDVFYCPVCER